MDFAEAGDGGDEGWLEFVTEAAHFGDGEFERGGHVLAGQVAGGEDEFADDVFFEGVFFEEVIADAFVCGQQDPTFRTNQRQPSLVENTSSKVREMALETNAELVQCVSDCARVTEIFV